MPETHVGLVQSSQCVTRAGWHILSKLIRLLFRWHSLLGAMFALQIIPLSTTLVLSLQCQQCEHFEDLSLLCTYLCCCLKLRRATLRGEMLIVHAIMIQRVSFPIVPCHSPTSPSQSQPALPLQRSTNTILLHNWVSLTISRAWYTYAGDSCLPLCCRSNPAWLVHSHTSHAFCD